jgi:hypothetical protein
MTQVEGRYTNSRKKISEESNKKTAINGVKRSVASGLKSERGNPHAIRNGSDIRVKKSCNCMLLRKAIRHLWILFMYFTIYLLKKKSRKYCVYRVFLSILKVKNEVFLIKKKLLIKSGRNT